MNKMFVSYALAIALMTIIPTQKTWAQAADFSLGGFAVDQLAKAIGYLKEAKKSCDATSRQITVARNNYHRALRLQIGIESARSDLYQILDAKDLVYLGFYVVSGRHSPQTKLLLDKCAIDGGIRPNLSKAFFELLREVRTRMGAKRADDMLFFDPKKYVAALEAERPRANAYVHARNLMETYASGVPTEKLFSAEAYLKILLEMEYSRPMLKVLQPGMDNLPQERFDLAIEVFGKKLVMQAAETLLKLQKTPKGELVREFPTDNFHVTTDPFKAFIAILKTETKGFVIFTQNRKYDANWGYDVTSGSKYYDDLVSDYGQDRVHQVVESIRDAPRIFDGSIGVPDQGAYKTEPDLWYLEELLSNPKARIVDLEDLVYVAANDTEAIIRSKGKIQIIYGRINDVRWVSGRKDSVSGMRTFNVYFAGVSKFGLWFNDIQFKRSRWLFGDDAKGLIGKLIRVDGYVNQSINRRDGSINPDWNMRISDGYYRIIDQEDWPDYLPIPEMQPARSLADLKAAVTFVEVEQETEPLVDKRLAARAAVRAAAIKEFPGALNCHDIKSFRKPAWGSSVGTYFSQIAAYAKPVARYEAYSTVCSGVLNPAIRGDFLQAAVGDFDAKYTDIFNSHVEIEYQRICPNFVGNACGKPALEVWKSDYQELMTVLKSDQLQYKRNLELASGESNMPKVKTTTSIAKWGQAGTPANSYLPAGWKKYAKTVGTYEALSEACSGELEPAIRNDFLDVLENASADQATQLTTVIERSYEKNRDARQKARTLCHESKLKRAQQEYQKMMSGLAAAES